MITPHCRQDHPPDRIIINLFSVAQRIEKVIECVHTTSRAVPLHRVSLRDRILLPRPRGHHAVSLLPLIGGPDPYADSDVFPPSRRWIAAGFDHGTAGTAGA